MVKNPVIVFGAQSRLVSASDSLTFTRDPDIMPPRFSVNDIVLLALG
jgi:hypothetical protein